MGTQVGLSTSSVYPGSLADTFRLAAETGYDGVEVMVWGEATRDAAGLRRLMDEYAMPVLSVHAPTLLVTQRVWGRQPWEKVDRSVELARDVGAPVVVLHPPFRWQREYARDFVTGVAEREAQHPEVRLSVENMFPWKVSTGRRDREVKAYLPGWDPVGLGYGSVTMDLSHTATAGSDAVAMARSLGPRLAHLHLADGAGGYKDEHLVPGMGAQPCAEVLRLLPGIGFTGSVAVEINTRKMTTEERLAALRASVSFAREHLGARNTPQPPPNKP